MHPRARGHALLLLGPHPEQAQRHVRQRRAKHRRAALFLFLCFWIGLIVVFFFRRRFGRVFVRGSFGESRGQREDVAMNEQERGTIEQPTSQPTNQQ